MGMVLACLVLPTHLSSCLPTHHTSHLSIHNPAATRLLVILCSSLITPLVPSHYSVITSFPFTCVTSHLQCHESDEDLARELAAWAPGPGRWLPPSEGRFHVFRPVTTKELRAQEALVASLPQPQVGADIT
jgi:hypothetical protein